MANLDITHQFIKESLLNEVSKETYAKIKPDMRIYMPRTDSNPPRIPSDTTQKVTQKPKGLWYAMGTEWIDWVRGEMPQWESKDVYSLDIDDSRFLKIRNEREIEDFNKRFIVKMYPGPSKRYSYASIDWPAVAREYSGIEISPYQYDFDQTDDVLWHYNWDVASGCIWDPSTFKGYVNLADE